MGCCFTAENAEIAEIETEIGFVFSAGLLRGIAVNVLQIDVYGIVMRFGIGFVLHNSFVATGTRRQEDIATEITEDTEIIRLRRIELGCEYIAESRCRLGACCRDGLSC